MPRKKGGLPYEVHPTPAKGKDGKNIMYVKPARGYKMNMNDVDQFFCLFRNKSLDKIHIVQFAGCRRMMCCLQLSAINKVLCCQRVSVFLPESFQGCRTNSKIVARPIRKSGTAPQIAAENPHKIVEQ